MILSTMELLIKQGIFDKKHLKKCKPDEIYDSIKNNSDKTQNGFVRYDYEDYTYSIPDLDDKSIEELKINLLAEIFKKVNTIKNIVLIAFILGIVGAVIAVIMSLVG